MSDLPPVNLQNVDPFDNIFYIFTAYICICERNPCNDILEFSFPEYIPRPTSSSVRNVPHVSGGAHGPLNVEKRHFYNVILGLLRFRSFVILGHCN